MTETQLAVVTGGAGDLGQTIIRSLVDAGYRVALVDRTDDIAVDAASLITADRERCRGFGANQENVAEVHAAFAAIAEWAGAPHLTVANAGYAKFAPMTKRSVDRA